MGDCLNGKPADRAYTAPAITRRATGVFSRPMHPSAPVLPIARIAGYSF